MYLKNMNASLTITVADCRISKCKKLYLTYPNSNLFKLLKSLEISFQKFVDSPTVFEDTL